MRPDGVEIFAPGSVFPADNTIQAALSLTARGDLPEVGLGFAGAMHPNNAGVAAETCGDWTQVTGFTRMMAGFSTFWWG